MVDGHVSGRPELENDMWYGVSYSVGGAMTIVTFSERNSAIRDPDGEICVIASGQWTT